MNLNVRTFAGTALMFVLIGSIASAQSTSGMRGRTPIADSSPCSGRLIDRDGKPLFPPIEHARLSNGAEIIYARLKTAQTTRIVLSLDAGIAADPVGKEGIASLFADVLLKGSDSLDAAAITQRQETLGLEIGAHSSLDRTKVSLSTPTANLEGALDLFADVVLHPTFTEAEFERARAKQLASIAAEKDNPGAIASQALLGALYGPSHPYARPGYGTERDLRALSREDLIAFHQAWFRPEKATFFVASNQPLAKVQPLLEARLGRWRSRGLVPVKHTEMAVPPLKPRIILIDKQDALRSQILGGMLVDAVQPDRLLELDDVVQILAGGPSSRLNTDLHTNKRWAPGVYAKIYPKQAKLAYTISAPVATERTGAAIAAMIDGHRALFSDQGITETELRAVQDGDIGALRNAGATAESMMDAMQEDALLHRPRGYRSKLLSHICRRSGSDLTLTAAGDLQPQKLTWVVVGNAKEIEPQLDVVGLPIERYTP